MKLYLNTVIYSCMATLPCMNCLAAEHAPRRLNVLMIIADDLRPELGCYGNETIKTPNIDRLAGEGIRFDQAYCNIPVSGASRASLLTGRYPRYPNQFVDFSAWASKDCPQATPISAWFKSNGYYCVSNGKVFHHLRDFAETWSEAPYRNHPDGYDVYWAEYNRWELWLSKEAANGLNPRTGRGPFYDMADVPDTAYDDGKLTLKVIDDLKRLKRNGRPFFMACGFWKPHLPFNAPKRYWDLYDEQRIPMATNRFRPEGLPVQVRNSGEINAYGLVGTPDNDDFLRKVKHGYYACVSYVDAQIGMLMQALDDLELADDTIVLLFGDHGWNLGEHRFVGKHNLMQTSTRIPLIIKVPGKLRGEAAGPVELVDLYPTLCELSGIPIPKDKIEGQSFAKVFDKLNAKTKPSLYIQWEGGDNAVTGRWNYAEWRRRDTLRAEMLFDHRTDPDENRNVVYEPIFKRQVHKLRDFIRKKKKELFRTQSQ